MSERFKPTAGGLFVRLTGQNGHSSLRGVGLRGLLGLSWGDRGATSAEYAILVSMIALVIIGAVTAFGTNVVPLFHVPASAL